MTAGLDRASEETRELRRCLSNLVSILALPATRTAGDPRQIAETMLQALTAMLALDVAILRLPTAGGGAPLEVGHGPDTLRAGLSPWLARDPRTWPPVLTRDGPDGPLRLLPIALGLHADYGLLVAGSRRADFPRQSERLLLGVAGNQVTLGLREALRLDEQRQLNEELDRRVASRTAELRAIEVELRRKEAFLAEAQRLSATGSFGWQVASGTITWSDQLYRIFGLDPRAPVTLETILGHTHPDDRRALVDLIETARARGEDFEHEHRLVRPDGSRRQVHVVAQATRDREGALEYIGTVQDVTERRRAEEDLARARAELAHVSRVTSLGALTASIAHEVNQPLSGIVTNAGTCLRMLAADPPNVEGARETARRTIRDGHRASEVIARLRALFARREFAAEPVDLNQAAREVVSLTRGELQRGFVVLHLELAAELPAVAGDRVQLQQVILNLLLNACEALASVSDRPRTLVLRTSLATDGQVALAVEDAGVGIGEDSPERLFEAFYSTKPAGMGIGLSVSRSIIDRHGGRLWATPNPGPGATFTFTVPAAGP